MFQSAYHSMQDVVPLSPAGQWDNGSIGNYWSDYLSRYPNATEIDHSGIGDTPYAIIDSTTYSDDYANGTAITGTAILGTAIDRYPLMVPFSALIRQILHQLVRQVQRIPMRI